MLLIAMKRAIDGDLAGLDFLYDEVIRVARSTNHKPALCVGLGERAFLHFYQSEYERAEPVLREFHNLAMELRDSFSLLSSRFLSGLIHGNLGRMSEAARHAPRSDGDGPAER